MNYSKIRHGSLDLTSDPNPFFSPIRSAPENPNIFFSNPDNFSSHASTNLRRSRSSASQRLNQEDQRHVFGLQAAVRRAFSMKRSSDDGYWRIHDGGDRFLVEEEEEGARRRQGKMKGLRRKGFIGLCKKLVGF